jgi:hypothetical protein
VCHRKVPKFCIRKQIIHLKFWKSPGVAGPGLSKERIALFLYTKMHPVLGSYVKTERCRQGQEGAGKRASLPSVSPWAGLSQPPRPPEPGICEHE